MITHIHTVAACHGNKRKVKKMKVKVSTLLKFKFAFWWCLTRKWSLTDPNNWLRLWLKLHAQHVQVSLAVLSFPPPCCNRPSVDLLMVQAGIEKPTTHCIVLMYNDVFVYCPNILQTLVI